MAKQDRQGVRTAPALERKYLFNRQFTEQEKSIHRAEQNMSREMADMMKSFMAALQGYVETGDFEAFKKTLASDLNTWETGIAERVTAIEGNIETAQGDIETAQGDIETAQGDIQKAQQDIETANGDIKTAQEDIQAIEDQLSETKDVVIAEGQLSGWFYRKWKNGTAECWKTLTHTTAINTAWGSLYHGTATSRQNYPFSFTTKPLEHAWLTAGSYQAILFPEKNGNGVNGASASACYNLCRPSAITTAAEYYINFHVIGKWK